MNVEKILVIIIVVIIVLERMFIKIELVMIMGVLKESVLVMVL